MKRLLLFLFYVIAVCPTLAQKLTVESFDVAPMDLSASTSPRLDLNKQPCALVKVQLAAEDAKFDGNVLGDCAYKTGEYWVYMSQGSYQLKVRHPNFVPLTVNFRDYDIRGVESKTTYVLTLLMPQTGQAQKQKLVINYTPKDAMVLIDSKPFTGNGHVEKELPLGEHTYMIAATGYITAESTVKLNGGRERVINEQLEKESVVAEDKVPVKEEKPSVIENKPPVQENHADMTKKEDDKVYEDNIEQWPRFPNDPGDNSKLLQWLGENVKYPVDAEENGIQGKVMCSFVIDKDGTVTDVQVIDAVDPSLDKEAVRVIKSMPRWQSGMSNGQAVRVRFTLPVTFKLPDATPSTAATSNMDNGHEWVDLGLSVCWATMNVGASTPSDFGDYFAWGEDSIKSDYSWKTYNWSSGKIIKYCTLGGYGSVDNKSVLDPDDDVAHVKWSGNWRMPTIEELKELREKCEWTWIKQDGHKGYMVTGPNGNSIFLPAAGYRYGSSLDRARSYGYYWSRTLDERNPSCACVLKFYSSDSRTYENGFRCNGRSVRPVRPSE